MRKVEPNNQFKRDLKLADKRGKDMRKIRDIIAKLQIDGQLETKYKPHTLKGNMLVCGNAILNPTGY